MAKGQKISGIWLPIQLDTSAVMGDMQKLKTEIASFADQTQKSFEGAINPRALVKGIVDVTKSFGQLRDSAKALDMIKLGNFDKVLDNCSDELEALSKAFGGTIEQQRRLMTEMVKGQNINQQIQALNNLQRSLRITKQETIELAKAVGMPLSDDGINAFMPDKTLSEVERLTERFRELRSVLMQPVTGRDEAMYLEAKAIERVIAAYQELHGDSTILERDYADLARAAGVTESRMRSAVEAMSSPSPLAAAQRLNNEYRELVRLSGSVASDKLKGSFIDTKNIQQAVDAFKRLHNVEQISVKHYKQIAQAAGVATNAVARYIREANKQSLINFPSFGEMLNEAMGTFGLGAGVYGFATIAKDMVQTSMRMENITLAFESVYNSAPKAAAQIKQVRNLTEELGISFAETADGAKRLFAASKGTELEADANQIYRAFSTMGAALKLTGEEMDSVFLAVSQIMSKGKVSAEELRLQLSERMPGAVNLFAKSIGVTVKELDKMLENGEVGLDSLRKFAIEVEKTYSSGAKAASTGLSAELARVSNAWLDLKTAFVDTDKTADFVRDLGAAIRYLANNAGGIVDTTHYLLKLGAVATPVYILVKAVVALRAALVGSGLLAALGGLASAPLAIAAGIGAAGAALWTFWDTTTKGEKALSQYRSELNLVSARASEAKNSVADLNAEVQKNAVLAAKKEAENAQKLWGDLGSVTYSNPWAEAGWGDGPLVSNGTGWEQSLSKSIGNLVAGDSLRTSIFASAKKLGNDFIAAFNAGQKEGKSEADMKAIIDEYATGLSGLVGQMKQTGEGGAEAATLMDELAGALVRAAERAYETGENIHKLGEDITAAVLNIKPFEEAYANILKAAKGTKLGEELEFAESARNSAGQLSVMAKQAFAAQSRLSELKHVQRASAEELERDNTLWRDFETAMDLVGQAAQRNKGDLNVLQAAIAEAGAKAGFTAEQVRLLQERVAQGFHVGAVTWGGDILSKLAVEETLLKGTNAQKRIYAELSSQVTDNADREALATAIRNNSLTEATAIMQKYGQEAKTVEGIFSSIGRIESFKLPKASGGSGENAFARKIADIKAQVTELRGAIAGSESMSFAAQLEKDLEKVDLWLKSAKGGTAAQRAEVQKLIAEWKELGKTRIEQIEEERAKELLDKVRKTDNRLVKSYADATGDTRGTSRKQAEQAKRQYDEDLKIYQNALDMKLISEQEFIESKRMLDEVLADQTLRAQEDMYSKLQVIMDDYQRQYVDMSKHIGNILTTVMDSSAKAISAFVMSGCRDFATLADAFDQMVQRIYSMAVELFAQQVISSLFSSIGGMFGGGSSFFGAGSGTSIATSSSNVNGLAGSIASFQMATGGVVSGGNISGFSGSIVSSPTVFSYSSLPKFASGTGIMGEAGPEAIMPLVRTSSGYLGVRAESEGSEAGGGKAVDFHQNVSINIVNNSDAVVQAQESQDDEGNMNIDIMIEKSIGDAMRRPGSAPYRALQNNWGGSPALANR